MAEPGPLLDPMAPRPAGLVLLDCRPGTAFAEGHLAGARRVDLERDLSAPDDPTHGGRHPLPALGAWCATLGRWGIGPDTPVAVYDGGGGGNFAARAWWMLRAVGHRSVRVIDGGFPAAVAAGWPVASEDPPVAAVGDYPATRWSLRVVSVDDVEEARRDPDWRVVDARSAPRWRGEVEPFDPIPGRIPGSVNLPWESCVGPDGRFLPAAELRSRLVALVGDTAPERVIASCGSGVTACHTLLAMEIAGLGTGALYVGSYGEWCRQGRDLGRG